MISMRIRTPDAPTRPELILSAKERVRKLGPRTAVESLVMRQREELLALRRAIEGDGIRPLNEEEKEALEILAGEIPPEEDPAGLLRRCDRLEARLDALEGQHGELATNFALRLGKLEEVRS
jgi:hypothetical protein